MIVTVGEDQNNIVESEDGEVIYKSQSYPTDLINYLCNQ